MYWTWCYETFWREYATALTYGSHICVKRCNWNRFPLTAPFQPQNHSYRRCSLMFYTLALLWRENLRSSVAQIRQNLEKSCIEIGRMQLEVLLYDDASRSFNFSIMSMCRKNIVSCFWNFCSVQPPIIFWIFTTQESKMFYVQDWSSVLFNIFRYAVIFKKETFKVYSRWSFRQKHC